MNEELLKYVRESMKQGYTKDAIIYQLRASGWDNDTILDVINYADSETGPLPKTERILFGQLSSLVVVAIFLLVILTGLGIYIFSKDAPVNLNSKAASLIQTIDANGNSMKVISVDFNKPAEASAENSAEASVEASTVVEPINDSNVIEARFKDGQMTVELNTPEQKEIVVTREKIYSDPEDLYEDFRTAILDRDFSLFTGTLALDAMDNYGQSPDSMEDWDAELIGTVYDHFESIDDIWLEDENGEQTPIEGGYLVILNNQTNATGQILVAKIDGSWRIVED